MLDFGDMLLWSDGDALVRRHGHETLRVEGSGRDGLRVRAALGRPIGDPFAGIGGFDAPPAPAPVQTTIAGGSGTIRNGQLVAEVSADGDITFRRADGPELLAEQRRHFAGPPARAFLSGDGALDRIEASFRAYEGERLYGLGQQQHGRLDLKGLVIDLVQVNTHVVIPVLLSSRGYGFVWNSPATGRVELAANGTRWVADAAAQLDYWVTTAATPAGIVERLTDATGRAPELPRWASGFWQSKLRYRTQEETLAIAREYRRRALPLDVLVIDGGHWTLMGEWRFEPGEWPDPGAMVAELRSLGVEPMVSVWPTVNPLSREYPDLRDRGHLIRTARGVPAATTMFDTRPPGLLHLHVLDATDPDARAAFWRRLEAGYHRLGIRAFWLDADEPEVKPLDPGNLRYALGPGSAVHNAYPLLEARAVHEGLAATGEREILSLNRSAWIGSQRFGVAVWSGDVDATFEALRAQIPAGLNIGLAGIPWWTTDVGGFKGGDPDDPLFRELLIRWAQFAVFCPIFRFHGIRAGGSRPTRAGGELDPGQLEDLVDLADRTATDIEDAFVLAGFTGGPNEVWSFGEETYEILTGLLRLRQRLRPLIHRLADEASQRGLPIIRPLFLEFPEDPKAWQVADQFLLGPFLLLAPVLEAGAGERDVYLPAGASWRDLSSGEVLDGGRVHRVDAPLTRIPAFLREGADVPELEGSLQTG